MFCFFFMKNKKTLKSLQKQINGIESQMRFSIYIYIYKFSKAFILKV